MFSTFEKIKELAKSKGVSLQTVATDSGFSVNYIYSIKNKKNPSVEHFSKIANYFNVSTDYLLEKKGENSRITQSKIRPILGDFIELFLHALTIFSKVLGRIWGKKPPLKIGVAGVRKSMVLSINFCLS